jgi:RHS repeat-associated protein
LDPNTGLWAYYPYTIYSGFKYKDWIGTVHAFGVIYTVASAGAQTYCGIQTTTGSGYSTDDTGFYLYASQSSTYVLSPSGIGGGAAPVDTNGNFVSLTVVSSTENDWTDTAGHVAAKVFTNTSNPNIQYEWRDSSGGYTSGATTTTVQRSTFNIKTNFNCSGVTEYTGTANLPTEIDLPNGQKYVISYEQTPANSGYYTGRVKRVTFPTGGYYEYDYPTSAGDGIVCADSSVNSLTRYMNDGTNTSTWAFSRAPSGSSWATTIDAPQMPYDSAANNSVYTFNSSGQQTAAQFYQGAVNSPNLKRSINITWATNASPATQTTILEDGHTENELETSYDNYGNLLTLKEHDWGTNAPGSVLRTTTWTYLGTTPYITANILNRATRVTVADSSGSTHSRTDISYDDSGYINYGTCHTGVPQHSDTSGGCSVTVRGNPTTVTTYSNAAGGSGSILHHSYYDNLGNLVRADMDCCQSKTWLYSSTTNYSFPDSSTRGSSPGTQLTTSATYNQYTGLVATSTDENSQVTNYTFDNLKRPTILKRPDSTQLTWTYTDATPPTQSSVTAAVPIQGSNIQNTITTVDGLGRTVTQKISDGTTTYSIVAMQYDPIGRAYMTSNPYTSSAQYWTTSKFDVLGRPTYNVLQDSSQITFSYATNTATVTDPAAKARKSFADGLGRMTKVFEDPSGLNYETDYSYNILNQLTGVTQGAQTRTYVYDDLGRVNKTTTPEAGTFCFGTYSGSTCQQNGYDSFGDLLYRTDARRVLTSYTYDNLNRLSTISYNVGTSGVTATPGVTLTYDQGGSAAYALGRLTSMTDGVGSETYSYNNLGEMTQLQKVIGSTTYTTGYAYNLAGELSSITYPSSRVVQQSFDTIGRLCAVGTSGSTCSSGTTYATGYAYNATFQVTGFNYGNGVAAAFGYAPDRLLLQSLAYTKGSNTLFSTNYWYKTDSTNCPNGSSGNNGQIQCIGDNVGSGRTVSYAFDTLYRLTSATTNGSTNYPKWGLSMTYDRYGNRSAQSIASGCTGITCPTSSVTVSATTNQITGSPYAYDANGNMTNDGNNTLVYDGENRALSATNGTAAGAYVYDGNSLRVKKCVPNCTNPTTYTTYIFSGSKVVAEYDNGAAPTSPSREYVYSGGTLLAKIDSSGTSYYHQDLLSNRVTTDSNGNLLAQQGHFPFGEQWYPAPPTAPPSKWLFTSYERDAESGNDYATMRYGINRLGRLSSPDLVPGSFANPQSLGRFAYVLNDPINLIDPWGLDPAPADPCATDPNQCISVNADSPYIDIPYVQPWGAPGLPLLISPARNIPRPSILSLKPASGCPAGQSSGTTTIISGSYTNSTPTVALGTAIGGYLGGPPGAAIGGTIGSFFGVGIAASWVPSTNSWYAGPTVAAGIVPGGGSGFNVSAVTVPPNQNPNAIANNLSFSATWQPMPTAGATVTKSPGSGPAVVGYSTGTRVPASGSASFGICVTNCGCS